ncbi:hypothetical protein Tco_1163463 [Tanacetum coccineum]
MSPENKAHFESEKEAIHLLLTKIGDEIYSTVDASKTSHEMWTAIERLQQGESLNIQDFKTNLFLEFGKFTSHDGESMESYYSRFYKMMNEMIRNNFWQVCYDARSEVKFNEIRAKRIAKNANPLALVAAASPHPDPYYQVTKVSQIICQHNQKTSPSNQIYATTDTKAKMIPQPITPLSETSSNFKNKNVDTSPRYKNDNQTGQFRNQGTVTFAVARETVGSQECRKPKRVKDFTYHKEKMLLCKQAEKGVPLQVEQADWLAKIDERKINLNPFKCNGQGIEATLQVFMA